MRVSIAMATCEGGRYLREQLDSLARQTRLPDELVISDDQSTDGTVDIARGFAAQASFEVRIEVNPRRIGVTGNFDHALSLCTGDIVLLSDQDDVWFPSKVEAILDIARGSSAACWMVDALLADASLATTGARKMEQIRAARLPDSAMVMGCCAGFRRDLLDLLLPLLPSLRLHLLPLLHLWLLWLLWLRALRFRRPLLAAAISVAYAATVADREWMDLAVRRASDELVAPSRSRDRLVRGPGEQPVPVFALA